MSVLRSLLPLLALCAGCTRCSPSTAEADATSTPDSTSIATSAASPSPTPTAAPQPIPTKPAQVLVRTSGWSMKLAANASDLFYGEEAGGLSALPLDGSTAPRILSPLEDARSVALLGDDVVWVGAHPVGPGADPKTGGGAFRCSTKVKDKDKEKKPTITTVRNGAFAAMTTSGTEVFLAEKLDPNHAAILRVTGPTVTRIAELEGRVDSIAVDATDAYVATSSRTGSKIIQIPRLPGEKKELPVSRQFFRITVVGDQILGTTYGSRFELFRLPKSSFASAGSVLGGSDADAAAAATPMTSLASDLMAGHFAVSGDQIYFLTGRSRSALLERVPISGGPATVVSKIAIIDVVSDLLVVDDAAYIAGRDDPDAGHTGVILKLPMR